MCFKFLKNDTVPVRLVGRMGDSEIIDGFRSWHHKRRGPVGLNIFGLVYHLLCF